MISRDYFYTRTPVLVYQGHPTSSPQAAHSSHRTNMWPTGFCPAASLLTALDAAAAAGVSKLPLPTRLLLPAPGTGDRAVQQEGVRMPTPYLWQGRGLGYPCCTQHQRGSYPCSVTKHEQPTRSWTVLPGINVEHNFPIVWSWPLSLILNSF